MQKEFTKEFMQRNKGCYTDEQLSRCSFMSQELITLESILASEIPFRDKYWFVCQKLAGNDQNIKIAVAAAEIVLPIYEDKYPDDDRPRKAIDAAKSGLNAADAADAAYAAYAADKSYTEKLLYFLIDFCKNA